MYITCGCCGNQSGEWSLPSDANFAFALHALASGMKFSKLDRFSKGMNLDFTFDSKEFRNLFEKASTVLI